MKVSVVEEIASMSRKLKAKIIQYKKTYIWRNRDLERRYKIKELVYKWSKGKRLVSIKLSEKSLLFPGWVWKCGGWPGWGLFASFLCITELLLIQRKVLQKAKLRSVYVLSRKSHIQTSGRRDINIHRYVWDLHIHILLMEVIRLHPDIWNCIFHIHLCVTEEVTYTEEIPLNLQATIDANMVGTEIPQPLQSIYSTSLRPGHCWQVCVFCLFLFLLHFSLFFILPYGAGQALSSSYS